MPVVVTAVFRPLPGHRPELIEALRLAIPAVHDEPGCELYAIHDADDGTVTMIEKWQSEETLDAHGRGEAVAALGREVAPHLDGDVVVTRMAPIPVGGGQGAL